MSNPTTPNKVDKAFLSQSELIKIRFAKHKLAVVSLWILISIYFIAAFAEFFAPHSSTWNRYDFSYAPPQVPKFSFEHGLHVEQIVPQYDPITLRSFYTVNPEVKIPLSFFAKSKETKKMWGILPLDRRFLDVDYQAFEEKYGAATVNGLPPTFYLLGGDRYGHDNWSRLIYGSRISLSVGLLAIAFTFVVGIFVGGISGYLGGRIDNLIQRSIEIINSFPGLPLWMALGAVVPSTWTPLQVYFAITMVLSIFGWTGMARVVRGKLLSLREEDYAVAARLLGASHMRIIFRHLLPGFTSHIIVALTMSVPGMILGETALSFLGLGLRPPVVSWGVLLQECTNLQVVANYPWMLMPVVMIILTVLTFNFLGDGLRDAADPYSSK